MRISRDITSIINFILDNICPPILRDCYPLMYPIYWIAGRKNTAMFLNYKDNYPFITDEEYGMYYKAVTECAFMERPTDLNKKAYNYIMSLIPEGSVCLDAGSGRGWLATKIALKGCQVTGVDIEKPKNYSQDGKYTFVEGSLEQLPFSDNTFDIVTCTHVLEHVRNFKETIQELIRVSKNRLIIALPRQREYRYVADLHIRYFPYEYSLRMVPEFRNANIKRKGGDWVIVLEK